MSSRAMHILLALGFLLASISVLLFGLFSWSQTYDERVAPNVFIGGTSLSGMTQSEVKEQIQTRVDRLYASGIRVQLNDLERILPLATLVGSDSIDTVRFDVDRAVQEAMKTYHANDPLLNTLSLIQSIWKVQNVAVPVVIQQSRLEEAVREIFSNVEIQDADARFQFTRVDGVWQGVVLPEHTGQSFAFEPFYRALTDRLQQLDQTTIPLTLSISSPTLLTSHASTAIQQALAVLQQAPYIISFDESSKTPRSWELTGEILADMLIPTVEGTLDIAKEPFSVWIKSIASEVDRTPIDARFVVENGRVKEFLASRSGIMIDDVTTRLSVQEAVTTSSSSVIQLTVAVTQPTIATEQSNSIGIMQILGVGTSSYRGSPLNRRLNIQNGVNLLNGILIPPQATFSLLEALRPFTEENGYLPELVIKGDAIKPELGGGLCQIGTTTFRAVMNSGLPIVERQNHSLVVRYYNDPSNGNPGTDATIYEPSPDFKFLNDTNGYIFFQAENLVETQELRFTFWGTSDGRTGTYSPPVVSRWIPAPKEQRVETLNLAPGVEQCQESHVGADASFTYTVTKADGTTSSQLFNSHYRPLQRICLVGVKELSQPANTTTEQPE